MQQEIAPSIPYDVELSTAREFGNKVLDRFRNPHININGSILRMNIAQK